MPVGGVLVHRLVLVPQKGEIDLVHLEFCRDFEHVADGRFREGPERRVSGGRVAAEREPRFDVF